MKFTINKNKLLYSNVFLAIFHGIAYPLGYYSLKGYSLLLLWITGHFVISLISIERKDVVSLTSEGGQNVHK